MSKCFWFNVIYAIFGAIIGLTIFFTFSLNYYNWNCAVCGLSSGVFACFCVIVHLENKRDDSRDKRKLLFVFKYIGALSQLIYICVFIYYIVSAITLEQSLTPYGHGYYLAAVWAFISWKWAFTLFISSHIYLKKIINYERMSTATSQNYLSI